MSPVDSVDIANATANDAHRMVTDLREAFERLKSMMVELKKTQRDIERKVDQLWDMYLEGR